tara:strand:- start:1260 stop:1688 length:429 start_codon:yes stop_codon:yes gene_type:complete
MAEQRTIQPDGHLHGVIVACQREDERWLLIRRSATVVAPLQVCFPGGGIDADESQADAVVREMREELDARVTPVARVWHHIYSERAVTLWGWHATLHSSELTANPQEVAEILWLTADEVSSYPDLLPRTIDFMTALHGRNSG